MSRITFVPLREMSTLTCVCLACCAKGSPSHFKEPAFPYGHCYMTGHKQAPYYYYLDKYTSVGSYPLMYYTELQTNDTYKGIKGDIQGPFCAKCALAELRVKGVFGHCEVNYEDSNAYCQECDEKIECAYPPDEEQQEEEQDALHQV